MINVIHYSWKLRDTNKYANRLCVSRDTSWAPLLYTCYNNIYAYVCLLSLLRMCSLVNRLYYPRLYPQQELYVSGELSLAAGCHGRGLNCRPYCFWISTPGHWAILAQHFLCWDVHQCSTNVWVHNHTAGKMALVNTSIHTSNYVITSSHANKYKPCFYLEHKITCLL